MQKRKFECKFDREIESDLRWNKRKKVERKWREQVKMR